jgi:small GTP-binding protein
MKLAIVGKRNAGKSTLVNTLAGEPRVIVSEIAGTTRDAIDVRFQMDGRSLLAIDTAGLRRKKSFSSRIPSTAATSPSSSSTPPSRSPRWMSSWACSCRRPSSPWSSS